ncbi:hypothetical protein EGW08_004760 [Elysia chlorotica]|uniref:Claudin n=1 Tax=Elysia chlorotica TaxID=188477 RepID=A0A433U123_ELYCH|nr:hypothetical protein EGW08_004760 [Elysia chlorotica]
MLRCRVKRDRTHLITLALTWLGCVQPLAGAIMADWWSVRIAPSSDGLDDIETVFYGTFQRTECYRSGVDSADGAGGADDGYITYGDSGGEDCQATWGFRPTAGKEAFSISQLFAMFSGALCAMALLTLTLHTFLEGTLTLLTVSAFSLGAAGMFGLLAVIVFLGFYGEVKTDLHRIGPAFYLLLFGSSLCLPAGGMSAWAAIRGGYYLWGIGKNTDQEDQYQTLVAKSESREEQEVKITSRNADGANATQAEADDVMIGSKEDLINFD